MSYGFRSNNIYPNAYDPAPLWQGRLSGETLEKAARFSATRHARRRWLAWAVEAFERGIHRTGGADWAVSGSNRCYAALKEARA